MTKNARDKSYIEAAIGLIVGAAALIYIWQWWEGDAPAPAPVATLPGAATSGAPQAVTGRPLKVYSGL